MIDKDIVGFQITMYDAMAVNVVETFENLSEKAPTFIDVIVKPISKQIAKGLE